MLPELDFELGGGGLPLQLDIDSQSKPIELEMYWKFKLAFGFDEDVGFFLYTFPEEGEGSEFEIGARLDITDLDIHASLLSFLDLSLTNTDISVGAGIFVDIDKEAATRKPVDTDTIQYGRLSRDTLKQITQKKDLFQICAVAAATIDIDKFIASIDTDDPAVGKWIPKLSGSIEAIAKKEIPSPATSGRRGRRMKEIDVAKLDSMAISSGHRALRMLESSSDLIPTVDNCDIASGELFCVNVTNIELDIGEVKNQIEPILEKFINDDEDGIFDEAMKPLLELNKPLPVISDIADKEVSLLDAAEIFVPAAAPAVASARAVIDFYRSAQSVSKQLTDETIVLAESCSFKASGVDCTGGVAGFKEDDGSEQAGRYLEQLQEMDDVFPLHDAAGNRMTSAHRFLMSCNAKFEKENNCDGQCSCSGTAKAKCIARKTKCKAGSIEGLSFPFLSDPASLIGLLSGNDIQVVDFSPPELVFAYEVELYFLLWTPPNVELIVSFEVVVTLKFGIILDSKGIREAIEEKNPLKALNSFAFKDLFDGVDEPLVTFQATVGFDLGVSAGIIKIGVSGSITFRVELDFYDPYPETSGGLIRPFELLSSSPNPLDWFEITMTISVTFSLYIKIGKWWCCGGLDLVV